MAVPVTLSFPAAGVGNRFYEDLQKLGRLQPKLCQTSPAKLFSHERLLCKCFWQLPRGKNTSRGLLRLRLAQGKDAEDGFIPNVSADTDDMFDDLFDRYGKVVYSREDKKPPSAEVDDDAESLSFAVELAKVANEGKAGDIKVEDERSGREEAWKNSNWGL